MARRCEFIRPSALYIRLFIMFADYRILSMVEIMVECPMCEGRAIVTDENGNSRCVRCNPKYPITGKTRGLRD